VRPHHLPYATAYAAVITPLPAGRYTVWRDHDADGRVADYHWS
jgi:hypothetical protein